MKALARDPADIENIQEVFRSKQKIHLENY